MSGNWNQVLDVCGSKSANKDRFTYYVIQKRESGKTRFVVNTCLMSYVVTTACYTAFRMHKDYYPEATRKHLWLLRSPYSKHWWETTMAAKDDKNVWMPIDMEQFDHTAENWMVAQVVSHFAKSFMPDRLVSLLMNMMLEKSIV